MHLRQAADHALAADVVGQTAERLSADDVFIAVFGQLQHFGRQQPAFAHLAAVADHALDQRFDVPERRRRHEVRMGGHGLDQRRLHALAELHQRLAEEQLDQTAAVEVVILDSVVDLEEHEAHDAGEHVFAVLRAQELFKAVVAQRGILDVDFAHHADARFRFAAALDGVEIIDDGGEVLAHGLVGEPLPAVELLDQRVVPFFNQRVGRALFQLVGARLVGDAHDAVAVDQRRDDLAHQRQGQLEAGGAFKAAHVDGDDRHLLKPRLFERLAQQIDVVAGAAAAAGLGDDQRDLVDVVFAGVQRVEELADDQQRGHAGVVVHIFKALGHDVRAAVGQQLGVVAVEAEHLDDQGKVKFQHVGHKDGVARLPHLAGKFNVIAGHGGQSFLSFWAASACCWSMAANSERRRMRTAPRLVISSILIWV